MRCFLFAALLVAPALAASRDTGPNTRGDWPMFGHDPAATRYSPLRQINAANVSRLERAWTFHTGKPGTEAIPVVINGVMYVNGANGVFAVNPETGAQIWHYEATKV